MELDGFDTGDELGMLGKGDALDKKRGLGDELEVCLGSADEFRLDKFPAIDVVGEDRGLDDVVEFIMAGMRSLRVAEALANGDGAAISVAIGDFDELAEGTALGKMDGCGRFDGSPVTVGGCKSGVLEDDGSDVERRPASGIGLSLSLPGGPAFVGDAASVINGLAASSDGLGCDSLGSDVGGKGLNSVSDG